MKHISFIIFAIIEIALTSSIYAAESSPSENGGCPEAVEVASSGKEACFKVAPIGESALEGLLSEKVSRIIGRIGCGAENARFMIVPSLDVNRVSTSSGLVRNVILAEGELTLKAVSIDDPDMIWHSVSIPLEAVLTGSNADPATELAKQINVSDAVYVRFVRVARKKIAEASVTLD
ncbi:MAG: hypothetical protein K2L22_02915 [Muribaculaceae bacterium]|nr:hypothetical protein [Muribaculaceae bacterium]